MTISTTTRKAGPYTGNGVTTVFAFAFKVFTSADVKVTDAVLATGVESTKVLTTDYTVTLNVDQDANPGGTVNALVAPPATESWTISSQVAETQGSIFANLGGFYPEVLNDVHDKLTILVQQVREVLSRSLTAPISASVSTSLPSPVASNFLGWNAAASAIVNYAGVTGVAVSAFGSTLVNAASAAAARVVLGVGAIGDAVFTAVTAAAARTTLGVAPRATRIDIASVAGTVDLTANAPDTDDIRMTGTNPITGVTIAIGRVVRVVSASTHSLANNANIVTGTGGTITCAANDSYMLRATAANVVEVLEFTPGAGSVSLAGAQTIAGTKTFSSQPNFPAQSMVQLNTANGYGSTNTAIRRFTNTVVNQGADITYADSATNGGSFTVNTSGVYAISYADCATGSGASIGLSLNSNQLTTDVATITAANRLSMGTTSAANAMQIPNWTGYIAATGVVRAHNGGGAAGTNTALFTITRIA